MVKLQQPHNTNQKCFFTGKLECQGQSDRDWAQLFERYTIFLLVAHIQTDLKKEAGGGVGCRFLHVSPRAEPLLAPLRLSFWKVGSRSRAEAVSRERSPCWCERRRLLQPLTSREERAGTAQTAHERKVWGSERSTTEQTLKTKRLIYSRVLLQSSLVLR